MFVCLCVCSDHLSLSPSSSFTPSLSHLLPRPPPLFPPRAGRQRKRDQRVHLSPHSASHPLRLPQCTAAVDWVIAPSQHTLRTSLSCRLCLPLLFYRHILLICLLLHTFTLHFKFNTGLLLYFVWWSSAHSFTPSLLMWSSVHPGVCLPLQILSVLSLHFILGHNQQFTHCHHSFLLVSSLYWCHYHQDH